MDTKDPKHSDAADKEQKLDENQKQETPKEAQEQVKPPTPQEGATSEETPQPQDKDELVSQPEPQEAGIPKNGNSNDDSLEDYASMTKEELLAALKRVIETQPITDIRPQVEAIKTAFFQLQEERQEAMKAMFVKEGGDEEEFEPEDDLTEKAFREQLKHYRKLKASYNREQDKVKDINLEKKYALIEQLKGLLEKKESIGDTFKEFRDIQQNWKEIGPVPQQKLKDLWSTYHHHVEKFYDYIKINKELRDLDWKKNEQLKEQLCEQAEELLNEPNVVTAFRTLQKYHAQWREIGPVHPELKEPLWERFRSATKEINHRHQEHFKKLKDEQKDNLIKKEDLCQQAENLAEGNYESHKEWKQKTDEIINLQKVWRTIGFAPKKDNNKIYARFRAACDVFFEKKREFYAKNKQWQEENLEKKIRICEQAESAKDSEDWKATTDKLINLQKEWKAIGPVPRKDSDKIWKRFRAACDQFFDRKSDFFKHIDERYEENMKLKHALIEEVQNYEFSENVEDNFEALKGFQERWSEIGFVPYKMKDKIQNAFREALNKQFDKLRIDDTEKKLLKFQTRLDNISNKPKADFKIRHERDKYMNKLRKLESNIQVWENNIGFFAPESKAANSMIHEFESKIAKAREEMVLLEEKIRMIDQADDNTEN
ncbi:MAG: DUF349 domain-containing protein [Bacteroidota bacterium]